MVIFNGYVKLPEGNSWDFGAVFSPEFFRATDVTQKQCPRMFHFQVPCQEGFAMGDAELNHPI